MVTASMYARFLKEREIKEKRLLEKEAVEKRRKEAIEKYRLERKLAEGLEAKLFRLEKSREYSKLRRELRLRKIEETKKEEKEKKKVEEEKKVHYVPYKPKKREEFIFTEEEKAKCRKKTLDKLVDEISGSQLVCPSGKELKKDISKKELTSDLICFRRRVRRKSPEEIVALYDRLLADDPERLCKEKKE